MFSGFFKQGGTESPHLSINHPRQPKGGRDLNSYEQVLGFRRKDLEGRRVLDLGAGPEVKFAARLAVSGIRGHVVSLSPDFANRQVFDRARSAHPHNLEIGFGQDLPFADRSFDVVVMFHVWEHLTKPDFTATAKEVGRVLDFGGWARLGPMFNFPEVQFDPFISVTESGATQELAENGVTVRQEPIPIEVMSKTRVQDHMFYTQYAPNYNFVLERSSNL
ncbi:MAG: class I SAM-dependent methyltransferase [Candidatus Saccharimonadales bacterium]